MPRRAPIFRPHGQPTYASEAERKRNYQRHRLDKDRQRFYGSTRWKKFRRWFLNRHPLCEDCLQRGRAVEATEVDHQEEIADRPDLATVEDNCRAKCKSCHSRKTARKTIAVKKE